VFYSLSAPPHYICALFKQLRSFANLPQSQAREMAVEWVWNSVPAYHNFEVW